MFDYNEPLDYFAFTCKNIRLKIDCPGYLTFNILSPHCRAVGWHELVLEGGDGWVDHEGHQEAEGDTAKVNLL